MKLRTALTNIHRDPRWWRKIMIGAALSMTIIGVPFAAGLVVEHVDNTRRGYASPLPPWGDYVTRYLYGMFALMTDFIFFIMPFLLVGLLFFCVAFSAVISATNYVALLLGTVLQTVMIIYVAAMFLLGVSPVGRLVYAEDGGPERSMSSYPLGESLRPAAFATYLSARLRSLPAYIPALIPIAAIAVIGRDLDGAAWPAMLLAIYALLCTLLYAHLVVGQIYVSAEQELTRAGRGRIGEPWR